MQRSIVGRAGVVGAVVLAALVLAGCQASRTRNRMGVLQAENTDLMQRTEMAEQQAREATLLQDRTLLELQTEKHRLAQMDAQLDEAEQRATLGEQATTELARAREDNLRVAERLRAVNAEIERLERLAARPKPQPAAPEERSWTPSPSLEAFARDLRGQLTGAGIDLPVETRTMRDGQQRVAVVLENAFPAGKASLSHNMQAVRAVVGLAQLVRSSYPGSRVTIEGHTDSDPPKVCGFRSNEELSLARADSVRELLVKAGVRADLIQTAGHGARHPIAAGNTDRAKAQNRRVEIYIEPNA